MNKPLLMIVDDEPDFREIVEFAAKSLGFDVEGYGGACDLQNAMKTREPDGIFTDIVMPDMDGNELIWWLAEQHCAAPIVLMSGFGGDYIETTAAVASGKGLKMLGTLRKPVKFVDVEEMLSRMLASIGTIENETRSGLTEN